MVKKQIIYECQECGHQSPKWQGKCFECGSFGTLEEVRIQDLESRIKRKVGKGSGGSQGLQEVDTGGFQRRATNVSEFDRVLNNGFIPGQVVLIGGEPGIGKSTLLLQVAAAMEDGNLKMEAGVESGSSKLEGPVTLYVSGEESVLQIKSRADRLGIKSKDLQVVSETDVDTILDAAAVPASSLQSPNKLLLSSLKLLVIDSIQTIYTTEVDSSPGNISQIQECTRRLVDFAKTTHTPVVIVGHVTKVGSLAGPKQLEHLVDTVLYLEGERYRDFRLLRVLKNRFGPVNEVGVFKMTEAGLSEVGDPSGEILVGRQKGVPGSVLTVALEGQRPLVLEIQALTSPSHYGYPRRTATGVNRNRVEMLLAVLQKRAGLNFGNVDVYVNVSGGFKIREPAADLAVALALASSLKDKPTAQDLIAIGELGLLGEVKSVNRLGDRMGEAKRLGFGEVISSESVGSIREAVRQSMEA